MVIFHCYVSLPEGTWTDLTDLTLSRSVQSHLLAFSTYVGHVFHGFSLWKAWDFQLILGYPGINSKSTSQIAPVTCPSQRCVASGARAVVKLAQAAQGSRFWLRSFPIAMETIQNEDSSTTWVCLKIGYIPNYSHLIGIMIINHWV